MSKLDVLLPGESVTLVPVLMIRELKPKWWLTFWKPFTYREATREEIERIFKNHARYHTPH